VKDSGSPLAAALRLCIKTGNHENATVLQLYGNLFLFSIKDSSIKDRKKQFQNLKNSKFPVIFAVLGEFWYHCRGYGRWSNWPSLSTRPAVLQPNHSQIYAANVPGRMKPLKALADFGPALWYTEAAAVKREPDFA
jgi:hypothetical protein